MTDSTDTLQPPPDDESGPERPRSRRRWPFISLAILVVLVIGITICFRINLNEFVIVPGQAQAVGPLISVPADKAHKTTAEILLTDVGVADVTVGNWLYYKYLDSNAVFYPKSDFIEPGTNEAEYDDEGPVEMTESQLTAAAVSLRQLGYESAVPRRRSSGLETEPGTDAYNALQIGDVITAVDGITYSDCRSSPDRRAEAPAQGDRHAHGRVRSRTLKRLTQ